MFTQNFSQNIPLSSRDRAISTFSEFEPRQRLGQSQMTFDKILVYILSISICMQSFITIVHSVRPFSLFQNLEFDTASTDAKWHFAISWARFGIPLSMLIVMGMQNFIKIYQKVQRASFTFFQNLNLGKTSTYPKYHLTISLATSCQYQRVCKISSQYSSQF